MPVLLVTYSVACYLFFAATFLAFIAFVTGLPLQHTLDGGPLAPWGEAAAIDIALLAGFGLQHSVMARASFKRAWKRIVPPALERSTYVLASTLALALIRLLAGTARVTGGQVLYQRDGRVVDALALGPEELRRFRWQDCAMVFQSALNAFNQMHEVPNVYVVDGSSFPTATEKNPTLTILAIAWRASDHLAEQLKRGA